MLKNLVFLSVISFGASASSISIVGQGMNNCELTSSKGSDWVRVNDGWKYETQLTVQCDESVGYHIMTDTSSLASSEFNVSENVKIYIDDDEACNKNSVLGYSSNTGNLKKGTGSETWNFCARFNGYDIETLTGHVNVVFSNTSFTENSPEHVSYIHFEHDKKEPIGADVAVMDSMLQTLELNEEYVFLVQGHTSLVGKFDYNEKLAKARVSSIKNELLSYPWINEDMVYIATWGEMRPSSLTVSSESQKLNRRVSVSVYKKMDCWPTLFGIFGGDIKGAERTLCK
jgi:outer membrane protein OmpA-like peptidoglycan-associated protein